MALNYDASLHEKIGATTNEVKNLGRRVAALELNSATIIKMLADQGQKIDTRLDGMEKDIGAAKSEAADAKRIVKAARRYLLATSSTIGAFLVFIFDRWDWIRDAAALLFTDKKSI